jgi:hypothetical protein
MAFPGKMYREGNRLKVQNFSGDPRLFFIEEFSLIHYLNDEIFPWMDKIVTCGANGFRTLGIYVWDKGQEEEAFVKVGSGYDLNRFNEPFFDYMKRWAKYAYERGVVIHYDLFDNCLFWVPEYTQYDPFYSLVRGDINAFTDLNNATVMNAQKRYVQKVVETLKPFPNVIFGVMNEYLGNHTGEWHYEISRYIKSLTSDHLVAGSTQESPGAPDPCVDCWAVHTGNRDFLTTGVPRAAEDLDKLRQETGPNKVLGWSNDGFGDDGPRETPDDMRRLTYNAMSRGLQLLAFMDHKAWIPVPGKLGPLNEATYRAMAEVFQPAPPPQFKPAIQFKLDDLFYTSLTKKNVPADVLKKLEALKNKEYTTEAELLKALEVAIGKDKTTQYKSLLLKYASVNRTPEGYLDIFSVASLPSTHPGAFVDRGGKAIRATTEQGFLCYGQYKKGYPTIPLQALFSIQIDNNTGDDRNILILDVYDHQSDRIIGKRLITRKDFPKQNEFCLFRFDFTPPKDANMEFRVYYMGYSYVLVDKIAVINPAEVTVNSPTEIPSSTTVSPTTSGSSTSTGTSGGPVSGNLVISDPLVDGRSVGAVNGGVFMPGAGYKITAERRAYIMYVTDIKKNIRIEFDAQGYIDREPLIGTDDNFIVMAMHDADDPLVNWFNWQSIPNYLYQIRKIGDGPTTNGISFKGGCGMKGVGFELASWVGHCLAGHPIEWNPNKKYHWEMIVSGGHTDVIRDGIKLFSVSCAQEFNPDNRLVVFIGGVAFGPQSPKNVTYSNVKIYRL